MERDLLRRKRGGRGGDRGAKIQIYINACPIELRWPRKGHPVTMPVRERTEGMEWSWAGNCGTSGRSKCSEILRACGQGTTAGLGVWGRWVCLPDCALLGKRRCVPGR